MKSTCGTDIIEIERIKNSIDKFGDRFLNTVFTPKEIEYCESKKTQKYQHYAARFAAKEAVFKALSNNINAPDEWKSIEILSEESGRPKVNLKIEEIRKIAKSEKVVAIGEIGLDYYWNKDNKEKQKEVFIKQINIANELNLPIIIHTRDAVMDTLDVLKKNNVNNKGIFHCCPLNIELVKEALKLGFYISFSGNITFKNAKPDEIIKIVPLDKILIETDCPYLAPEPNRGKRNDSSNLIYIADKISKIKGIDIEKIAKITYENAKKIFNL